MFLVGIQESSGVVHDITGVVLDLKQRLGRGLQICIRNSADARGSYKVCLVGFGVWPLKDVPKKCCVRAILFVTLGIQHHQDASRVLMPW